MSFSEYVSWLINSGNRKELNGLTSHMLTNEVTINFNVFRTRSDNQFQSEWRYCCHTIMDSDKSEEPPCRRVTIVTTLVPEMCQLGPDTQL